MLALVLLHSAHADDGYDAMLHALSIKDPVPACTQVESLAADPVPLLLRMVNEVPRPSWVAIRAADCLVTRHGLEIETDMKRWVTDARTKGLGLVALDRLDEMEPALAVRVATVALAGAFPDAARTRIARSHVDAVRTLATP